MPNNFKKSVKEIVHSRDAEDRLYCTSSNTEMRKPDGKRIFFRTAKVKGNDDMKIKWKDDEIIDVMRVDDEDKIDSMMNMGDVKDEKEKMMLRNRL